MQSFRIRACKELRTHIDKQHQKQQQQKLRRNVAEKEESEHEESESTSVITDQQEENDRPTSVYDDSERFERLVLRVASLKKIDAECMEEFFFNEAIGNVQINSIIPSILGADQE